MKIVIDTNRLISALLVNGSTRRILFYSEIDFYAPELILEEFEKYEKILKKRTNLSSKEMSRILKQLFSKIKIVSKKEILDYLEFQNFIISDKNDRPFLACAKFLDAEGIWTHDKGFLEQREIRIFTNIDLINLIDSNS